MDKSPLGIREALQTVRLFSDALSPDQLDELARQCSAVSFAAGATLMRQGDPATAMICIVDGIVSVSHIDSRNRNIEFRHLTSGSVVGELELLTDKPRIATVTAVTEVSGLEISKPALDQFFARAPDLLESFRATWAIREAMFRQMVPERRPTLLGRLARAIRKLLPRKLP